MLMSAPAKREDKPFIPKQDAMIEFKEERKLTRRERRECKKNKKALNVGLKHTQGTVTITQNTLTVP